MSIAYVQIYLDQLSDLLDPDAQIDLREDPKEGVYVSGASWHTIHNAVGVNTDGMVGHTDREYAWIHAWRAAGLVTRQCGGTSI